MIIGITGEISMAKDIGNKEIISTIGHYQKPGAPINITHNVARVAKGEVSDINATLTTTLHSGEMEVTVTLDEGLSAEEHVSDITKFVLSDDQNEYKMNFKVSSQKDGLYYIRLLAKVDDGTGAKMRAMAIPVYVGAGRLKKKSKQVIMKAMSGENISISKAQETIEIIE
jgi:hypothetical protein